MYSLSPPKQIGLQLYMAHSNRERQDRGTFKSSFSLLGSRVGSFSYSRIICSLNLPSSPSILTSGSLMKNKWGSKSNSSRNCYCIGLTECRSSLGSETPLYTYSTMCFLMCCLLRPIVAEESMLKTRGLPRHFPEKLDLMLYMSGSDLGIIILSLMDNLVLLPLTLSGILIFESLLWRYRSKFEGGDEANLLILVKSLSIQPNYNMLNLRNKFDPRHLQESLLNIFIRIDQYRHNINRGCF